MRFLLIDQIKKDIINQVREYANLHRITKTEMQARLKDPNTLPIGDNLLHTCFIDDGYTCVFSVEEHPMGWCNHLSVSVDSTDDKLPSIPAVQMLLKEFGINKELEDCCVYIEDSYPKSVNIISQI